jgi:tight adherence protein B
LVIVLGLAAGLVIGAPLPALAVLGLAAWQPVLTLGTLVVWAVVARGKAPSYEGHEAAYLQAIAGQLRAGSTLRHAICTAAPDSGFLPLRPAMRLAAAGQPLDRVADELTAAMPRLGSLTASSVRTVGVTGGRAADVFDSLALLAREEMELVRERRAATAQGRFSALIVGGIPVAYLGYASLTGKLAGLVSAGPVGTVLFALGILFLGSGILAMWAILQAAER